MGNKLHTNFTPLIDEVAADVGLVAATIFGVVWRYCQMDGECCTASLDRLAERAFVDKRTVIRHLKILCDAGYLRDQTPDVRNRPHEYQLTEKAQFSVTATGNGGVTESHPPLDRGDIESPHGDRESLPAVTESHPGGDRESLEETLQETPEETIQETIQETTEDDAPARAPAPDPPAPAKRPRSEAQIAQAEMTCAIADLCFCAGDSDKFELLPVEDKSNVRKSAKQLRDAGYSADDVEAFGAWWRQNDWRGVRGDRPTVRLLKSEWAKFLEWRVTPGKRRTNGHKSSRAADMMRRTDEAAEQFLAEDADG